MVSIASQVKGLDNIASSFQTNGGLSEQAVDVLRQFVESGSVNMYHRKNFTRSNGNDYILRLTHEVQYQMRGEKKT